MAKFTVWVCNGNGQGTTHVSSHEAESATDAKNMALDETLADWDMPAAAVTVLHVLGIAKGEVELVEWNDGIYGY